MDEQQLPPGWELSTIEEIARTATGGTPRRNHDEYYGGDIPWVKSGDLTDGIVTAAEEFITSEGLKNSNAKIFPRGAICIALYGATVGKLGVLDMDAATNQAVCGIFPHESIEPRFVFHSLRNLRTSLIDQAQGGAQPNISNGIIKQTQIPIPPLPEQRRIVAKIEALQERSGRAAKALEEVGPLLEQFRQSILAAAFSGRLTADWRAKNPLSTEIGGEGQGEGERKGIEPAHELLARIRTERRQRWEQAELAKYESKGKQPPKDWKDKYEEPEPVDETDLPELPEGWCWTTVDSISAKVSDGVHKKPNYVDFGIPFITVKNLTCGPGISFEDTKFISQEDHAEFVKRTHPEKGDVLVTKDGATLGRVRLVETDRVFSIFVSVALIKLIDPTIAPFIVQMLESPQGQEAMKVTGTGIQHIHLVDLRATVVPLPPSGEQKEIVRLVNACLAGLLRINEDYVNGSAYLTQLNQSILAKAFRGELVPQDPNDEPASELLARIRREREVLGDSVQGSGRKKKAAGKGNASESARPAKRSKRSSKTASLTTPDASADSSPEPARPQRRRRSTLSNNEDASLVIRVLAEGGAVNIHADTSGPTVQFYTKSSGGSLLAEIEDIPEAYLKPRESKRVANLSDLMEPDLALLYPNDVNETYLPQLRNWYTWAAPQLPEHFESEFLEQAKSRWSAALHIEEPSTSQAATKAKRGRLFDA